MGRLANFEFALSKILIIFTFMTLSCLGSFKNTVVWLDPFISVEDMIYTQNYSEVKFLPLVEQISTRFRQVMVPIHLDNGGGNPKRNFSSLKLLPSVVSKFNQKKLSNGNRLDVWVALNHSEMETAESVQELLNICNEGSVTAVLEYLTHNRTPRSDIVDELRRKCKYGKILPLSDCFTYGTNQFVKSFRRKLDILLFTHVPNSEQVKDGNVDEVALNVTDNFKLCRDSLLQTSVNLQVGFMSEWPDTDDNGNISYENLVNYWGNLSSWAASNDVPVVMRNAFDTAYECKMSEKTRGWWRVREEMSDIKFEEKTELQSESEQLERLAKNLSWLQQSTEFSREHVIFRLDPFISNGARGEWKSSADDEANLLSLLQQVYTKTSKIIIHEFNLRENDKRLSLIPSAAANMQRFTINFENPPLEVMVTVREPEGWTLAKSIADNANTKFGGTVKTIVIQINVEDRIFPEHAQELLNFFKYASIQAKSGRFKYRLAGMFFSEKCFIPETSEEFTEEIARFAPFFDQLFFMELIDMNLMKLGVDRMVPQLTTRFLNCRRKIRGVSRNTDVGLLTGWSDTDGSGNQNVAQQIKFWEMMNAFAVETNTKLIFLEAFDQLRKGRGGHLGWWRLVEDESYKSVSEYVFIDKKEMALNIATGNVRSARGSSSAKLEDVGIAAIVIGVGLTVVLAIIAGLFLVRKRWGKQVAPLLTTKEVKEFFHGIADMQAHHLQYNGTEDMDVGAEQHSKPYNKHDYELVKGTFNIDERSLLGCGEFGKVCRGKVKLNVLRKHQGYIESGYEEEVNVAVKMMNDCNEKYALKGLLSEIKILSYLGMHENIVGLIGAYTASLMKENSVFLFLEMCELGSLEKYLKKNDIAKVHKQLNVSSNYMKMTNYVTEENFLPVEYVHPSPSPPARRAMQHLNYSNVQEMDLGHYINIEEELVDISKDLYRWAREISSGMEFLASKKVVHADLATRNVLLTSDKTAKISDFGLSRKLYDYTNYVKTNQEPLPWRWMSPEALRKLSFNEKTDVWSFGVTLWEIFTCATVPYPGLSWDVNFCNDLEEGVRLTKPPYCDDDMYEVMKMCWEFEPEHRPTFKEITELLCENEECESVQ